MNFAPLLSASPQMAGGIPAGMQMGGYQPPPQPPPQGGYPPPQQPYQPSSMPGNVAATLCYALGIITGVLFLFLEPYNRDRNIRFHAWQSIFTFGGAFALQIGLSIMGVIASNIFGLLGLLVGLMSLGVSLLTLGLWIFLMVKAYQGERFSLPVIGPLAEQKA
ncbi:MAG: hypothetical protein NTX13_04675 [Acidobacteria bacterium]|nr:hypothetical protein [Acidobacteriota bacterium]